MEPYWRALDEQLALLEWCRSQVNKGAPAFKDQRMVVFYKSVAFGETYCWTKPLCSLLEASAASIPEWSLREEDVPSRSAFVWFEEALRLPDNKSALQALSWHPTTFKEREGCGFVYLLRDAYVKKGLPVFLYMWHFSETLEEAKAQAAGSRARNPVELSLGEDVYDVLLSYTAALLVFLGQPLVVSGREQPSRAVRKRVAEWRPEPVVNVVKLRQPEHHRPLADERKDVEWSCQWIVRGHWRMQPYPSRGITQPKWIPAHLKGPDGKPLKQPRATVFAVVR